ncbi:hypothetical protein [Methylacidiphilum caldifontis]|uniref:Uncharacterized protein n=1 Tax=Methylacidiphilum caldifontis TaxID=2795386 RepID=A0A4Y8PHS5_9BACT|nr:hypothetical protein [Methylacidiphilum caldifontis]QSR88686.1 hypothetical protein IT6_10080 [Methylacidiphilum caldifontis]TFE73304.1 hypothetical protein A7Q10_03275 [Methylacidiphilum caldifontis]
MRRKKNPFIFFFLFLVVFCLSAFSEHNLSAQDGNLETQSDYPLPSQSNAQTQSPLNPIQYNSQSPQENQYPKSHANTHIYGKKTDKNSQTTSSPIEFTEELPDPTNGLKSVLDSLTADQRKIIEKKFHRDAIHAFVGKTDSLDRSYLLFAEKTQKTDEALILVFVSKKDKIHYLFSSLHPFSIPPQIRLNPYDRLSLTLTVVRFEMAQTTPEIFTQTTAQKKKENLGSR